MGELKTDIDFFLDISDKMPVHSREKSISAWIEGRRVMPPSSPFPGVYTAKKTPYAYKIMEDMSPYSVVRHLAVKKAVQTGFTTIAENVIGYYIGCRPSAIMMMSATDALLEKFSTKRLDPLIDSCDLRKLIFAQTENLKSRKSGDKTQSKQFVGGFLELTSAQSAASMRSDSIKILIRDEIDGCPLQLHTGEGNFLSVSEGRTEAFEGREKIMDFSTPTLHGESAIDEQYNKGTRSKYFVPCPHCGKEQYLKFGTEKSNYGLKGDYKAGKLIQGYYQCEFCHDAIFDFHKPYMLENGIWRPTAEPVNKSFTSYHLPSFYSPPGMTSFTKIREKYDEAQKLGDEGMRSFTNLYLGKSFKPSGERPKFDSVIEIRSSYKSGVVPGAGEVLFLTMAADVQEGIKKYKDYTNEEILKEVEKFEHKKDHVALDKMPRLEVEVLGHGQDFRTSSIIYKCFYGHVDDHTAGAWNQLQLWAEETNLTWYRKDGYAFQPKMIFIDSGDMTDTVYNFCDPWPMTYPIKGARDLKEDKLKTGYTDEKSRANYTRFKLSKSGSTAFVLITTNYYKGNIYRKLKNKPCPINGQPKNCHQTPADYPDKYFKALTAEEQKKDGSFHNPAQRRNEALDLMVYNLCASDFYIEGLVERDRDKLKRDMIKKFGKFDKNLINEKINRRSTMLRLEAELRKNGW